MILVPPDITALHALVRLQRLGENWSDGRSVGPSNCTIWDDGYIGTGRCLGTATSASEGVPLVYNLLLSVD